MVKRLFFAVKVPVTDELERIVSELGSTGEKVKTVAPSNMHITLKFLGDTQEWRIPPLLEAMDSVIEGSPFEVLVAGTGTFGRRGSPSVLWAGIEDDGSLRRLASSIDAECEKQEFKREKRGLNPHLTLARVKRPPVNMSKGVLERWRDRELCRFRADRVTLFYSTLTPNGPVYSVEHEFRLDG